MKYWHILKLRQNTKDCIYYVNCAQIHDAQYGRNKKVLAEHHAIFTVFGVAGSGSSVLENANQDPLQW